MAVLRLVRRLQNLGSCALRLCKVLFDVIHGDDEALCGVPNPPRVPVLQTALWLAHHDDAARTLHRGVHRPSIGSIQGTAGSPKAERLSQPFEGGAEILIVKVRSKTHERLRSALPSRVLLGNSEDKRLLAHHCSGSEDPPRDAVRLMLVWIEHVGPLRGSAGDRALGDLGRGPVE